MGDRLPTIDMGRKVGAAAPISAEGGQEKVGSRTSEAVAGNKH